MHEAGTTINVPVDVTIAGAGRATRDGKLAPNQSFARIQPGDLKVGDWMLNPGTRELHVVTSASCYGVKMTIKRRRQTVVTFATWDDVSAALWRVVE